MTAFQPVAASDPAIGPLIKLAVMAVGGQGGGVLTGWIEGMARAQGYVVQSTSVAGVAQRTGATIYYIEMAPSAETTPVFCLAPSAGDVDILVASEMMEVGRAIQRGFVTPDRTVLIGSTHRALAVSEKMAPGDGIANADEVRAAAEIAARGLILADFEALAVGASSVISASLLGALARSEALPFPRAAYEEAIQAGGKGVEASLRAFSAGFDAAGANVPSARAPAHPISVVQPKGAARLLDGWQRLEAHIGKMPASVQLMALEGLRKVVGFQDLAYGADYLDRLDRVLAVDGAAQDWEFACLAAKHVANAMAYDDVIRVADEKTRATRFLRIQSEMGVASGSATALHLTDYTHPRGEEIVSLLPARLGRPILARPGLFRWIDRRVNRGRRLRTDRVLPFAQLWLVAGLRRWRRGSLRFGEETAHLDRWLATALDYAMQDKALAAEVLKARRLIKGYSDTHARGMSKFDRVMAGIDLVAAQPDAADWARRLIVAALADEEGKALDGAIATIRTF